MSCSRLSAPSALLLLVLGCPRNRPASPDERLDVPPMNAGPNVTTNPTRPEANHRPATRADCNEIVDANVDARLRADGVTDPAVVEPRKRQLRAALAEDIDKCIGKTVSDELIDCVRHAQTTEEIDTCLH